MPSSNTHQSSNADRRFGNLPPGFINESRLHGVNGDFALDERTGVPMMDLEKFCCGRSDHGLRWRSLTGTHIGRQAPMAFRWSSRQLHVESRLRSCSTRDQNPSQSSATSKRSPWITRSETQATSSSHTGTQTTLGDSSVINSQVPDKQGFPNDRPSSSQIS
jgi:hypothetical protein